MTAPRPGTPAEAAATTPGQAAHEAYWRDLGYTEPPISWDRMHPDERRAQETGAQAAISAGTGKILAEAARYKAERDEARDKLAADCGCGRGLADCARDAARDRDIHAQRLDEKRQELSRVTGEFAAHVRKCGPGAIEELEAGNARLAGELAELDEAYRLAHTANEKLAAERDRYRQALDLVVQLAGRPGPTVNSWGAMLDAATAALGDGG